MRALVYLGALVMMTPWVAAAQATVRIEGDSLLFVRRPVVRDTARIRALTAANDSDVLLVVNQLRAREAGILEALASIPPARVAERRALEGELAKLSRDALMVMSVIESRCVGSRTPAPAGYLGLTVTSDVVVRDRNVHVQRSVVSSIEPGSPAERAGLARGDVIVSIAGQDAMLRFPEISELLEPGRKIEVQAERDGRRIDVVVTVAPRPQRFDRGCQQFDRAMQSLRMGGLARLQGNPLDRVQDSTEFQGKRMMVMVPTAPTPPAVISFGTTMGGSSHVGYFAGAQFRALDDDWRGVLGLRPGTIGVLVNEVALGSAAAQSGLRVGDVVIQIDGAAASSPLVAVRLLGLHERTTAALRVVRGREVRVVQLRWGSR